MDEPSHILQWSGRHGLRLAHLETVFGIAQSG